MAPHTQSLFSSIRTRLTHRISVYFQLLKDYIYSYTYSKSDIVIMKPYDPAVQSIAQEIITKIRTQVPTILIHFVGSSSLKIAGLNDVDIIIERPESKTHALYATINNLFQTQNINKGNNIEWKFIYKKFPVEITVMKTTSQEFIRNMQIYNLFKSDPRILQQYEQLKWQMNGKSMRTYIQKRFFFFNSILPI